MEIHITLAGDHYLSLLSIYAPTFVAKEEDIMSFYTALRDAIRSIPKAKKLIILGDFNGKFSAPMA